jgi:serine/threonine-protein kinase
MSQPVREGEVLAGKYVVERVLGQGGMGVVVAARHIGLDERVAVKFLLPELLAGGEAVARFLREARATVHIKNEHIAKVTDVGQLESGAPYMVMEYLEGVDLAALLQTQGVLPIADAVDFVVQASEVVAEAHVLGIIHRDLKPSNLMRVMRRDGSPCIKVLDFGISKVASQDGAMTMTRTSAVLGSPLYMSPEQMTASRDVDGRADIWSLGVILYELLSGRPPFAAESPVHLGMLIATERPAPVSTFRPDVPAALDAVVARCLMKSRDERFRNVAELVLALAPFSPGRSRESIERTARVVQASGASASQAAPPSFVVSSSRHAQTQTAPAVGDWRATGAGSSPRNKTWLFVGAATFALAAAGVGLAAFVKPGFATRPKVVSTPEEPPVASAPATAPPKPSAADTPAAPSSSGAQQVAGAPSTEPPAPADSAAKPNPGGAPAHRPPAHSSPAVAPPKASSPPGPKSAPSGAKPNYEDM